MVTIKKPKVEKIETYEVHFPIEGDEGEVDCVGCKTKLEAEVIALFDDEDDCVVQCYDRNAGDEKWHSEMARMGNWIVRHKEELIKVLSKK